MSKPLPQTMSELVKEEREFLHDLANPLAVAAGMLEAYQDELARSGLASNEALDRKLAKLEDALARIGELIKDHRPRLVAIGEKA